MCNNANREFRKIPSLKYLYEINSNGTIFRNVKSKKNLKIKLDTHHSPKGYYVTFVHTGGRGPEQKIIRVMIHKVVAECWLGKCPDGYEVDHIDRNSHNNDYRNLRYVTKSEQMKNRDHSNISATGTANLEAARRLRAKPVRLQKDGEEHTFESYAECSRWMEKTIENANFEQVRHKLKSHRHHIYGYEVTYLNEETVHGSPTGQETVH